MTFNGTMFIPNFINVDQSVQRLIGGQQIHRELVALMSIYILSALKDESRLKVRIMTTNRPKKQVV
jgi:hypothetical protein